MKKLLIFHPALAPYRIDLFNLLSSICDTELVLLGRNLEEQKFDQEHLLQKLRCKVSHLVNGVMICGRYIRTGFIAKIRDAKPNVVFGYEFSLLTIIILLYKKLTRAGFEFVTMTDDNLEQLEACSGVRKWLRAFVAKYADGIVVTNEDSAEFLHRRFGGCKVVVVPIIYDEKNIRSNADLIFKDAKRWREDNLGPRDVAAFFIGRLASVKNVMWLLDKVDDKRWPKYLKLFLVGDGPLREVLEKKINGSERLGRLVTLLGRKEGAVLQTLFAAEDFIILPSLSETFGAVISESLHWGARCLVSTHVGAKSLINASNGYVFNMDDDQEFYHGIGLLADASCQWREGRSSLLGVSLEAIRSELINFLGVRA